MKIAIIGTGSVGSTIAYTLALSDFTEQILLIDINKERSLAEALDISHAMTFSYNKNIISGDYSDLKDANIIVITAGANQKKGETRIDLLNKNLNLFKEIIPNIKKYTHNFPIIIVATNPVDIMTEVTLKLLQYPTSKVIGTGTVLDSARFKSTLGAYLDISPFSIQANVIGEHGDSEVLLWSSITSGSTHINNIASALGNKIDSNTKQEIDKALRFSAYEIIKGKGATYYGIASATLHIINSIITNNHAILNISSHHKNSLGKLCYSMPTIIGKNGIIQTLIPNMNETERQELIKSIKTLSTHTQNALSLLKQK